MPERTCSIEGCDKKVQARGWCGMHYARWRRQGDPGSADPIARPVPTACAVDGCDRPARTRGWCHAHYTRWLSTGELGRAEVKPHPRRRNPPKICSVDGCDEPHYGNGLCNKHWLRQYRRGTTDPWQPRDRVPCRVDGCESIEYARGVCTKHYIRLLRHADINHERPDLRGDEHPTWKGTDVGYVGIHARVRRTYGKASEHMCVQCEAQADDWAYDHLDPDERIYVKNGHQMPYSTTVEHYQPMCKQCHREFDGNVEKLLAGRRRAL